MNVWDTGWSLSSFYLIARVHQPALLQWVAALDTGDGVERGAYTLDPDPLTNHWIGFDPLPAHPHFPFGFNVDPD
jgi:hypothetical protein